MREKFGLFVTDGSGPVWRCGLNDLDEAKRKAKEIAETEGIECFVHSLEEGYEVERFQPSVRHEGTGA